MGAALCVIEKYLPLIVADACAVRRVRTAGRDAVEVLFSPFSRRVGREAPLIHFCVRPTPHKSKDLRVFIKLCNIKRISHIKQIVITVLGESVRIS